VASSDIEQIKEKLDIAEVIRSYIQLTPAGKNFKAVCPFHKEKTPSFVVSPDRQTWHCFGQCNEGGDVISFVMKYENVEFYEALKALAEKAGVELRQLNPVQEKEFGVLYDITAAAEKFFEEQLAQSQEAREYITGRNIHEETREEFGIGFAPNTKDAITVHLVNAGYAAQDVERAGLSFKTERGTYMDRFRGRIVFPLKNTFSKTVSFSGRILPQYDTENIGKYINGPESPIFSKSRLLYAFDKAKQEIKKAGYAIIVEGQMDLITLFQEGVRNAVATSGTALTQSHLQSIRKITDKLVLAFDSDEAGLLAAERALDLAHMLDFSATLFFVQGAKDASEYAAKHPGKLKAAIEHTQQTPFDFYYRRFFEEQFKGDAKRAARAFLQKVLMLASPIDQNTWLKQLAGKTGIPEGVLYEELRMVQKNRMVKTGAEKTSAQATPVAETRTDKITARVALLCAARPELAGETDAYAAFIPPYALPILQGLRDPKAALTPEQKKTLELVDMKSSTEELPVELEEALREIRFLLRELKKEFLKAKREQLVTDIRRAEQQGRQDEAKRLLQEFDELAKLQNNE
jgi:DNA primase